MARKTNARKRNAAERNAEGLALIKQKASMKHGEFLAWIKANKEYSVASGQRWMREAKAQGEPTSQADLNEAWQRASMEERCKWMSEVQGKMFETLYQRVKDQDAVMARRKQAKGSYSYM